jgi:phenol 2-monooxygenase
MPVFIDNANSSRDLRVLPTFATPLPHLSIPPKELDNGCDSQERYDVVIGGVRLRSSSKSEKATLRLNP